MAIYATTQAGNWNDVATWGGGGFPSNGDTVTITHTVTYNISDDTNTITSIALNTGGMLQWTGSTGTLILRFTNMTISGGKLIGRDGTFLRCLGYIQVTNTTSSEIDMKGSVPNLQTTLSTTPTIGNGYISVVDSSGFGVGDYISVYDYDNIVWNNQTNECFIINGISGNNIYIRRFVGPKFTLIQDTNSGTNIFYTDTDVRTWTTGMKFVIDTEVFEVDNIDIFNKIIYSTANVGSTYSSGSIAYETGIESSLTSGYTCYKLCATIVGAVAGNNYIDVGSAGGWTVNDVIALGGVIYSQRESKIIQSISTGGGSNGSDRITFTTNLTYSHTENGIATKLNRDCVFHGYSSDTIANVCGYIYILAHSANRTFRFENFEMRYYGSNASTVTNGLCIRNSYNRSVILLNVVGRHAAKTSYNGFIGSYSYYYDTFLNNVIYDTNYGFGSYSASAYKYNSGNIMLGINTTAYWGYNGQYNAIDYNIFESVNTNGLTLYSLGYTYFNVTMNNKPANRYWYNRFNYVGSPLYINNNNNSGMDISKLSINNPTIRMVYNDTSANGMVILDKLSIESATIFIGQEANNASRSNTYGALSQLTIFNNYNFVQGNIMLRYCWGYAEMDENIKKNNKYSWKFTPKSNNTNYFVGFFAYVLGLPNRTLKIGSFLRKDTTTNATVLIDVYDDLWNLLASDTITTTNIWEWKNIEYTFPNNKIAFVRVGGYGSTGNFWVSTPTIYSDGCLIHAEIFNNFWIKGDPTATGVRLSNGVKIIR